MAVAKARGGGAMAQPAQRAGLGPAARAPRWGRATTLAILAALVALACFHVAGLMEEHDAGS